MLTFSVFDDFRVIRLHDCNAGVCGSEIDTNDTTQKVTKMINIRSKFKGNGFQHPRAYLLLSVVMRKKERGVFGVLTWQSCG